MVLVQATEHRGTGFLPFFAKRKRERRAPAGRSGQGEGRGRIGIGLRAGAGRSEKPETGRDRASAGRQQPRMGQEQMQSTVLIQTTAHRGTGILPFFAKGSEKGEGDRQVSPFTPSCPGRVLPGLPRGGKGFYVSGVMMLLGPPGPIPRGRADSPEGGRVTFLAGLCCLARPALYRAGLVVGVRKLGSLWAVRQGEGRGRIGIGLRASAGRS